MIRQITAVAAALLLFGTGAARAQDHTGWPERVFIAVDGSLQMLATDFSESVSITDAFVTSESDTFNAAYARRSSALANAGLGVRLAGSFGVGVAASWSTRSGQAAFDLSVPSPLTANAPRTVSDSVDGLARTESAVHIQAIAQRRAAHTRTATLSCMGAASPPADAGAAPRQSPTHARGRRRSGRR